MVDDQVGRLSFTSDIAAAIRHLLDVGAPYGIYNVTGAGEPVTWADVARRVFSLTGQDPARVTGVSTEEYFAGAAGVVAPRPRNSVLRLERIRSTGFAPVRWEEALERYLASTGSERPTAGR